MCADRISRAKDIGSPKALTAAKFVDKCVPVCSVTACALLSAHLSRIPLPGSLRVGYKKSNPSTKSTTRKKPNRRIQTLRGSARLLHTIPDYHPASVQSTPGQRRQPVLEHHAHPVAVVLQKLVQRGRGAPVKLRDDRFDPRFGFVVSLTRVFHPLSETTTVQLSSDPSSSANRTISLRSQFGAGSNQVCNLWIR